VTGAIYLAGIEECRYGDWFSREGLWNFKLDCNSTSQAEKANIAKMDEQIMYCGDDWGRSDIYDIWLTWLS